MPTQIAHKIQGPVPRRPIGGNFNFKPRIVSTSFRLFRRSVFVLKTRPWSVGSTIFYKLRSHVPRARKLSLKFGLKTSQVFQRSRFRPPEGYPVNLNIGEREDKKRRICDPVLDNTVFIQSSGKFKMYIFFLCYNALAYEILERIKQRPFRDELTWTR